MLATILHALSFLGLAALIYGRHRMITDAGGVFGFWKFALRFLPFADLVFMVRHYRQARTGGFIAIAGLWLMVPHYGTQLWHDQEQFQQQMEGLKNGVAGNPNAQDSDEPTAAEIAQMSAEEKAEVFQSRQGRLVEKEKLVAQLNARTAWWHQQLQARKAALDQRDEAVVAEFNADAAAYARFNAVAKEKNQELLNMRSVAKR